MSINFPSAKEVVDRVKTAVQNALPKLNPFLRNSLVSAIVTSIALRIYDIYYQLQNVIIKQFFPDTATDEYLERWGTYRSIIRDPAERSSGYASATGTVTTLIPSSTELQNTSGVTFETQSDATISNVLFNITSLTQSAGIATGVADTDHQLATGLEINIAGANESEYNGTFEVIVINTTTFTYSIDPSAPATATGTITGNHDVATLDVRAVDPGANTNMLSGDSLTFTTPIANVDDTAIVQSTNLTGGTDTEADEDYRARILFAWQEPVANFNKAQIIVEAFKISGVTRVWVEEATPVAGQVTIYFVRDNDHNIIPSASDIQNVKDKILEIKPATINDTDVIVAAPTPVSIDFTFSSTSPSSASMHEAIINNLTQFFEDEINVSQDVLKIAYESAIYNTIDESGVRLQNFILTTPTTDITIANGELGVLGNVTF